MPALLVKLAVVMSLLVGLAVDADRVSVITGGPDNLLGTSLRTPQVLPNTKGWHNMSVEIAVPATPCGMYKLNSTSREIVSSLHLRAHIRMHVCASALGLRGHAYTCTVLA